MAEGNIVMHGNVAGYFKEQLDGLCQRKKMALSEEAGFYVVNLLSDFAQSDKLFLPSDDARSRELVPLAELMARAADAVGEERARILKHLADSSLYLGGFFQESLDSRNVDVTYVVHMGEGAYQELSGTFRGNQQAVMRGTFRELAEKFGTLMDLLADMAAMNAGLAANAKNVLKLYEKWMMTGSARLGAALRRQGVILAGGDTQ